MAAEAQGQGRGEYLVWVEFLAPEDRERFLRGMMKSLNASKTEFSPPHEWGIRPLTDAERQALGQRDG